MDLPSAKGRLSLLQEAMEVSRSKEPDTGFLIVSSDPDGSKKFSFVCHSESQASKWIDYIKQNLSEEIEITTCQICEITSPYCGKIKDQFIAYGIGFLRTNRLIAEPEEDEYECLNPEAITVN